MGQLVCPENSECRDHNFGSECICNEGLTPVYTNDYFTCQGMYTGTISNDSKFLNDSMPTLITLYVKVYTSAINEIIFLSYYSLCTLNKVCNAPENIQKIM